MDKVWLFCHILYSNIHMYMCRWQSGCASYSKDGLIWLVMQSNTRPTDSTIMLLWVFSWSPSLMYLLLHLPSLENERLDHHDEVHIISIIFSSFIAQSAEIPVSCNCHRITQASIFLPQLWKFGHT